MITPPMKRPSAVTQSKVVAVPKSTTIVSTPVELDRGEHVDDPVGADAERLVHVELARAAAQRASICDAGAAGGARDALDQRLGHARRHRGEAHGAHLVGRVTGREQERRRRRCPTRPGCGPGLVVSRQCASSVVAPEEARR